MNTTGVPPAGIYSRTATGLVREVALIDHLTFAVTATTPLVSGLIVSSFVVSAYPRANFLVALLIAGILSTFVLTCIALLTAALPKVGGDYVFNSRILHPVVGFVANLLVVAISPVTAGLIAGLVATVGLSPALSAIGIVTGSGTLETWSTYFTYPNTIFLTGAVCILIVTVLSAIGTRLLMRTMTWLMAIFALGVAVDLALLLFTSQSSFASAYNHLAGAGAYDKIVAAGSGSGLYPSQGGYSVSSTIGTIFFALGIIVYCFWGTYISSEVRRAGQRRRMLITFVGAGVLQTVVLMIAWFLLLHTVGENFFISATAGNMKVGFASFPFFMALAASNPVLVVVLSFALVLWTIPGINANMAMVQRGLFAYSFEGLLPRKIADVSDRTHTPILAAVITGLLSVIGVALYAYWAGISTLLSLVDLFPYVMLVVLGLAAVVMPWRRPDIYRGSPADWRLGGLPVLPIVGALTMATTVFAMADAFYFRTASGLAGYERPILIGLLSVILGGVVWWYAARAIRRRQGIDLDLVYRTIPPD